MTVKERLKFFLKKKKISEREFAEAIGVSNGYVSAMRQSIPPDKLASIAKHFPALNTEWLIMGTGEMIKGSIINNAAGMIKPPSETIRSKSGLCWEQLADGSFLVSVDLVPFEAHGRYISEDTEYYAEWEQVTFNVPKMGRGNYLGFKHKGESMFNPENPGFYDIRQGMKSLARELGRWHWKDGFRRKDAPYGWILITNKNILHKDITGIDLENGTITCSSRNPDIKYAPFELELNDVYQIFKIITVNH